MRHFLFKDNFEKFTQYYNFNGSNLDISFIMVNP